MFALGRMEVYWVDLALVTQPQLNLDLQGNCRRYLPILGQDIGDLLKIIGDIKICSSRTIIMDNLLLTTNK